MIEYLLSLLQEPKPQTITEEEPIGSNDTSLKDKVIQENGNRKQVVTLENRNGECLDSNECDGKEEHVTEESDKQCEEDVKNNHSYYENSESRSEKCINEIDITENHAVDSNGRYQSLIHVNNGEQHGHEDKSPDLTENSEKVARSSDENGQQNIDMKSNDSISLPDLIKMTYDLTVPYETCCVLGEDLLRGFLQDLHYDCIVSVSGVDFKAHK